MTYHTIIIGAGAAGLFCAAQIGRNGKKVFLFDHAKKIGAKILISGGGRCNFTNLDAGANNYLSANPHFMKSALKRYTPWDFISLMAEYGLTYTEKKLGQLFCDQGSKAIVSMLEQECKKSGVDVQTDTSLDTLVYDATSKIYTLNLSAGETISAPNIVVATGGLSIPKMGATGLAYQIAKQFQIPVTDTAAALVPFTFEAEDLTFMKNLTGLSIDALVTFNKTAFRENILFTHRGISGPAILQISSYWTEGQPISINLIPEYNRDTAFLMLKEARQNRPKIQVSTLLSELLPNRFAKAFTARYLDNAPLTTLSNQALSRIATTLTNWQVHPTGTEGYRTAEVTKGGIDTDALSSKTMESNTQKGLYFIGECVDVTGWLGGYNFQWAWASAMACATAIKCE